MKGAPLSARARLWLDLALFGALFLAYNPAWTGLAVHEWLCVVAIVPLLFHVIVNWNQTLAILRRFAELVRSTPQVNLVVDGVLFVVAVTAMLSGLLVSQYVLRAFGLAVTPTVLWAETHKWSADLTSLLLLVHFGLHWRWIVNVAGKLGRRQRASEDDPIVAIRLAIRRLEAQAPAGRQRALAPIRTDERYRP